MNIGYWGETESQEKEAKQILALLWMMYPNHPWYVHVYQGGYYIKYMGFAYPYVMNTKFEDVCHDATTLKHDILIKAGEWLERAGLARSAGEAEAEVTHLEGAAPNKQPDRPLPDDMVLVMPDGKTPLRTEPRPQAAREAAKND